MMREMPLLSSIVREEAKSNVASKTDTDTVSVAETDRMLLHHDGYIGDDEFEVEGETTEEKLKLYASFIQKSGYIANGSAIGKE